MSVTYHRLREALSYNEETGEFLWISPPWNHAKLKGTVAGSISTGYVLIKIDGRKYKAHRLAWLFVYGEMPPMRIDHKDGNPFNNSIANLRLSTPAQNCANSKRWRGKSLPKGVRYTHNGRYQARISYEKRQIALGVFDTVEAAASAYERAAIDLYGEFARAA